MVPRSFVYAATYATPVGRLRHCGAHLQAHSVSHRLHGPMPGHRVRRDERARLRRAVHHEAVGTAHVIGVAARNVVGLKLQVNDSPQSDPFRSAYKWAAVSH